MAQPLYDRPRGPQARVIVPEPRRGGAPWGLIGAAAGIVAGVALVPAIVPALAASAAGSAPHIYWYISRAAAFVAFGLLWLSMMAGLGITSKLARFWPGLPGSFEIHRFAALLGLGFGTLHALVLLGDQYINYSLGNVLVPFMAAPYRPAWVGLGQVALYSLAVVGLSFYVRDRLGVHAWRMIHALSFGLFLMVLVHGFQSGTDSHSWWAIALYAGAALTVLFGSIYRVLSVRAGHAREAAPALGRVIAAGQVQTRPAVAARGRRAGRPTGVAPGRRGQAS